MPIKLTDTKVKLTNLLLDADNYRVTKSTKEKTTNLQNTRKLQNEILADLKKQKLADLKDSILKNGFLTVDRIVVKKVSEDEYLVIEGNRRVAALKSIREDYVKGYIESPEVHKLIEDTEFVSAVLVKGTEQEIKGYSDALMGIRHVSGAKKWHGWQSAKLVNSLYNDGHTLSEIGEMLGITSKDAGRRMRGYRAFQQLEQDPVYGEKKESHHYAILLEFLSANKKGREWLDWNEDKKRFEKKEHLERVYKAIVKDKNGNYEVRNIDDARDFLARLETKEGQAQVLKSSNFRKVQVIQEKSDVFDVILHLLEDKVKQKADLAEEDIDKISTIYTILAKLKGE